MLIGQWYSKEKAEIEANKLDYGYVYYYNTEGNLIQLGDKEPPKEWGNRVFTSTPYDFWADNSTIKLKTELYPLMPVSPDPFDGYWVTKDINEKLGLVKLALR